MPLRWSHAVVYVKDLPVMLDFYEEVLGFEVTDRGPLGPEGGPEIVFLSQVETDHHQLAFLPFRQGDEPSNTHNHMAFRVETLAQVKVLAARLEQDARASELRPTTHGNAWSIYFKDPEGNGVEVFCDSPWHVQQPQARPFDITQSEQAIHEWTEKEFSSEPGFGPIQDFYARRAARLGSSKN